jgi:MFS family permease
VFTHLALAAASGLISLGFGLSTLERWLDRRKPHELAWTVALFLFTGASAALWLGESLGWAGWSFRLFYLLGAIVNVPWLALGTVYLLAGARTGDRIRAWVVAFSCFAAGVMVVAPLTGPVPRDRLPRGSEVFGPVPRVLAGVGSAVPALVILGGALWSAWRLFRHRGPARLAVANLLIAAGTLVLGAGGVLNSVVDAMNGFAISLVLGISLIFGGFLATIAPRQPAAAATPQRPPPRAAPAPKTA